jgi:hypothetical protein
VVAVAEVLGADAAALRDGDPDRLFTLARMDLVTDRRAPEA